ncbi:MAG: KilA-N domain-containing protein [Azonexus sp.]|nr:KilA-N domain-containing protein [Azonexus sp.]
MKKLVVQDTLVSLTRINDDDYISLTDIARVRNPDEPKDVVKNWLRNRSTVEYLGLWEKINNVAFKGVEFDSFRLQAGSNSFTLSPNKWIEATAAIGIKSTAGRGGGTYAHRDIAFEFASWVSAEFKLYLIKEFQRLKEEEAVKLESGWDIKRSLAKINYKIHTDAIKETIIPHRVSPAQSGLIYASEADLLNVALFGMAAKEWREQNPNQPGNIRDAATVEQLVVLSNLESLNAAFIRQGVSQTERLKVLNDLAIGQLRSLLNHNTAKNLK